MRDPVKYINSISGNRKAENELYLRCEKTSKWRLTRKRELMARPRAKYNTAEEASGDTSEREKVYDINEESKALESSNNEVHDEFTQSRFRGVAYRREILDNSPKGERDRSFSLAFSLFFLLLISSSPHSYLPTIVS